MKKDLDFDLCFEKIEQIGKEINPSRCKQP